MGLGSYAEKKSLTGQGISTRIDEMNRTAFRSTYEADLTLDTTIILTVDEVLHEFPQTFIRSPSGKILRGHRERDASH
jgi:hypothetical protein